MLGRWRDVAEALPFSDELGVRHIPSEAGEQIRVKRI